MPTLRSAPQSEETPELQGSKVPQNDGTDKGSVRTPPDISDTPNTSSLISSTVSYTRWHHIRKKKLGKSTGADPNDIKLQHTEPVFKLAQDDNTLLGDVYQNLQKIRLK